MDHQKLKLLLSCSIGITSIAAIPLGIITQAHASSTKISINVSGLKAAQGQMCYSLYTNDQGFPYDHTQALRAECIPVRSATSAIAFGNLTPGNYSVAVYHDINNDNKLNTGLFGIPKEGFGFSKNPVVKVRPPKFWDTAVLVPSAGENIRINLQHR